MFLLSPSFWVHKTHSYPFILDFVVRSFFPYRILFVLIFSVRFIVVRVLCFYFVIACFCPIFIIYLVLAFCCRCCSLFVCCFFLVAWCRVWLWAIAVWLEHVLCLISFLRLSHDPKWTYHMWSMLSLALLNDILSLRMAFSTVFIIKVLNINTGVLLQRQNIPPDWVW